MDSPRPGLPTAIYKTDFGSDSTISQPKTSLNPSAAPFSGSIIAHPMPTIPASMSSADLESTHTLTTDGQSVSHALSAPLRRSSRVTHQPDRLAAADVWNPQSRLPPRAYAAFPFPAQAVVPSFLAVLPDLGPDPQT